MPDIVGGSGGGWFEDPYTAANLAAVRVKISYGLIDKIQCEYDNGGRTNEHGGNNDNAHEEIFRLSKDEAIITAYIWSGNRIDAIQFQTTRGRLSPKFGGSGGTCYVFRGTDGNNHRERALMGFKGRCGSWVDALGAVWSNTRELGKQNVVTDDRRGGNGGGQFNMLLDLGDPMKTALKSITIRSGSEIDAISCTWSNKKTSGRKGGDGGGEHTFELDDDERIIAVYGRSGSALDQLQFETNKGNWSPVYGGSGGGEFTWRPPSTGGDSASDANMSLLCFQGASGSSLDSLSPCWAVDPPVKFELNIKHMDDPEGAKDGEPQESWTDSQVVYNNTTSTMTKAITWEMQCERSTTVSLSESSRTLIGGSVEVGVTATGKAGVPFVAEGEVSASLTMSVSTEHEWSSTTTADQSKTIAFKRAITETVTAQPGYQVKCRAIGRLVQVKNLGWSGEMKVTYASGYSKTYPVSGVIDSANSSTMSTYYDEEKI